jgi:hypothetical protein
MPRDLAAYDCDAVARVFERCIESFVASLSGLGYCTAVVQQKRAMVMSFARWARRGRLDATKIDEAAVGAFLVHLGRRRIAIGNRQWTLLVFLEHLVLKRSRPVQSDGGMTPKRR